MNFKGIYQSEEDFHGVRQLAAAFVKLLILNNQGACKHASVSCTCAPKEAPFYEKTNEPKFIS